MTNLIFYIWLCLMPYSWIIAAYSGGIIAIDKIIAPLLLFLGVARWARRPAQETNRITLYLIVIALVILSRNLPLMEDMSLFLSRMGREVVAFGYFAIPLLLIANIASFRVSSWIITINAMVGLVTPFLVAYGLLSLPLERFETSRIGIAGLPKAIGIFPSYGDLAQFSAYALIWLLVAAHYGSMPARKVRKLRYLFYLSICLGLLGAQSRNLLLGLLIAVGALWTFRKVTSQKYLVYLTVAATIIAGFGTVFLSYVIDILAHLGGGQAANTAEARMSQYSAGWDLIVESPIFGIVPPVYSAQLEFVLGIHNIWISSLAYAGIVGTVPLLLLFSRLYRKLADVSKAPTLAPYTLVARCYFVVMLFSTMAYPAMAEPFWTLLGVAAALTCLRRSPRPPSDAAAVRKLGLVNQR